MLKIFEVCFYTGALFTVISFLLSQFGHIHGVGGHSEMGDLGGHGVDIHGGDMHGMDAHGVDFHSADVHGADVHGVDVHGIDVNGHAAGFEPQVSDVATAVSPFKPTVISAFVTTFGGVGIILGRQGILPVLVIAGALGAGLLAGYLLYRFVIVPLYKAQNTSAVSVRYLRGVTGKMTLGTEGRNFGKVSYVVNGNTMTSPALSWNEEKIPAGKTVVVVDIKKNTFYVKEIKGVD